MPELPEVETTCNGIRPHIQNKVIVGVHIRNPSLRWPVPADLEELTKGQKVKQISRRGKYIVIGLQEGSLIIHLGMSGGIRVVNKHLELKKHDHVDIEFANETVLRYHDPRRFGCILWTDEDPQQHKLLIKLGVEPLSDAFHGEFLFEKAKGKTRAVKVFLMDSHIVVGVGNIYANEALFMSGIDPQIAVKDISHAQLDLLADNIKAVLEKAIESGGTTLRDFINSEGKPGYFQQQLNVYGRTGEKCVRCDGTIKQIRQGQRSTFYCPECQR
ncbi:MAG: bifunctional DNA-formamidopyrimidine glycosylase/DNA-(apurinic or apyrimidinic site) lyase [Gammaproteobacteria bacterium]|nr:MAG: bifunctional DNA-formamidopyrimidine glycosylase/DNA-(apurinic or apyrimidinic site) lyase [Gammaproteobacteria bacterium]